MYESHFGFSGSPFQLNPDPAFYFDSRGHSNALAYLKFGAHQGEGFIVVTGEIGAGKTTLVRTLLEGLNPDQVVAAQVVSTQLESSELLQAILMAFGIPSPNHSKAHLIASLEAYLTALAAKGRRALLIIDEAQNLKHEAVEELRMLSNFQLGKYGLLQSFLVGQPELRGLLQSKSMEQLRQRVIASCHLGPLDEAETRAYIEHRLKRVGWKGSLPAFAPGTFEAVHRWTGGVPRKINRLCNRMLLGAFLANANSISLALVDETAAELRSEIGEAVAAPTAAPVAAAAAPEAAPSAPSATPPRVAPQAPVDSQTPETPGRANPARQPEPTPPITAPVAAPMAQPLAAPMEGRSTTPGSDTLIPAGASEHAFPAAQSASAHTLPQPAPTTRQVEELIHRPGELANPLICLVDSPASYLKAGLLQDVFQGFPSLPGVLALHLGPAAELDVVELQARGLPLPARSLHLGIATASFAARTARVMAAVDGIFDQHRPSACMVLGNSDDDLSLAMLANKRGVRLLRVGSGQRDARADADEQLNAAVIERLADLQFTDSTASFYALYREGIRLDRVRSVGNLTNEMLDQALASAARSAPKSISTEPDPAAPDYGLIDGGPANVDAPEFGTFVASLSEFGTGLRLVWVAKPEVFVGIAGSQHAAALKAAGVSVVRDDGYFARLALLRGAKCLLTRRDGQLRDEAKSLGIPVVQLGGAAGRQARPDGDAPTQPSGAGAEHPDLHTLLLDQAPIGSTPEYWHIGTASRIAGHLVAWFARATVKGAEHAANAPSTSADAASRVDAEVR